METDRRMVRISDAQVADHRVTGVQAFDPFLRRVRDRRDSSQRSEMPEIHADLQHCCQKARQDGRPRLLPCVRASADAGRTPPGGAPLSSEATV